jgi:competence protein ComEC
MKRLAATLSLLLTTGMVLAQKPAELRVYFIDVEGGQSTLFVAPGGETLLIDTGNPGHDNRDASRIAAVAKIAGVTRFNNILITHYHNDHVGGVPQLVAQKIPIGRFIDHGPNREENDAATMGSWTAYQKVLADTHISRLSVKAGETLPLKELKVQIVSADGQVISKPLPGAGAANPACASSPTKPLENTENDRSAGSVIAFGKLRLLDLGDLTWANERPLMCPINKLGQFDVYIVSHHGLPNSGSPAFVDGIAPRVAIMDNGPLKGGDPTAWQIIKDSPRMKDLWQLHTAEVPKAKNVTASHIANLTGPDSAHYLLLTGRVDGSFTVFNSRTGETVPYPAAGK